MHMQVIHITFITIRNLFFLYASCHCYLHHSTQDLSPSKSFLLLNFRLSLSLCNHLRQSIPNLHFMCKLTLSFSYKLFFSFYRLPSLQFQTSLSLCKSPSSFNSKPYFSQLSSLFNSKPFFSNHAHCLVLNLLSHQVVQFKTFSFSLYVQVAFIV